MSRRRALTALGTGLALLARPRLAESAAPREAVASPPHQRYARLTRGLNASLWYDWLPADPQDMRNHITGKFTTLDFAQMLSLGFSHIRIPIQPDWLAPRLGSDDPSLDGNSLELLDDGLSRALGSGLAVVLDCQASPDLKARISASASLRHAMVEWWRNLADHVANHGQYHPEWTFLELFNEPGLAFATPLAYRAFAEDAIRAIREKAPQYTIVVGGPQWGSAEDLFLQLRTPIAHDNLIYSFHFYKPIQFTHQGAAWASREYGLLHDLPWDVDRGFLSPQQVAGYDPAVQDIVRSYNGEDHRKWSLAWAFTELAKWSETHGQRVWLGEFGVWRSAVRPEHRVAWIRDVRELAEEHGFGWCLWEAVGAFGLFLPGDSRPRMADPAVLAALGLN